MVEKRITFRDACCNKLGISGEFFEEKVLLKCLPGHYRLFGRIMWQLAPSYFEPDLIIIRDLANCTSESEVRAEVNFYHDKKFSATGFGRKLLCFRMSGRRVIRLATELFSKDAKGESV